MELYVGGSFQGKLKYVRKKCDISSEAVYTGKEISNLIDKGTKERIILDQFHLWVRECMKKGENPEEAFEQILSACPKCIVISDEIGNGIVPVDEFEREYRDRTGRILIEIAKKAEKVERIICGMGQRLK